MPLKAIAFNATLKFGGGEPLSIDTILKLMVGELNASVVAEAVKMLREIFPRSLASSKRLIIRAAPPSGRTTLP